MDIDKSQFIKNLDDFIESGEFDELVYEVINEYGDVYLQDVSTISN